jgi:hypothetical protein
MTPEEAVARLDVILAHAWMVRTFLKHADEVQDDEDLLGVPRTVFDYCRAVEPARQRGDVKEYLHRIRGKLPKLRRAAELFAAEYRRASTHTNFEMAAASLSGCVREIEAVLAALPKPAPANPPPPAEAERKSGVGGRSVVVPNCRPQGEPP